MGEKKQGMNKSQDNLTAERDRNGANDVKCFLGSLHVFNGDSDVVEGGKHILDYRKENFNATIESLKITEPMGIKNILIIGDKSYIGCSLESYLSAYPEYYRIGKISVRNTEITSTMFVGYDVVLDAAGIVHREENSENRELYFEVNHKLTVSLAEAAKKAGVKQFIIISTMNVYGRSTGYIKKTDKAQPKSVYGESKLLADNVLLGMEDDDFKVVVLRPPMVYGKDCKGNYQRLRMLALNTVVFPDYKNKRSMIYIGNLCEFIKRAIDNDAHGIFFPQNAEYVCTSDMVKLIAKNNRKKITFINTFNPLIRVVGINTLKKVFGDLTYEKVDVINKYTFEESIALTENNLVSFTLKQDKKKALLVTTISGFVPQFEMNSVSILQENGYEVHYASNFNNVFYGKDNNRLDGTGIIRHQIDFSRSPYSKDAITAYKQLNDLLTEIQFDVIHCHTPLGGALARLVGNKHKVKKIIYTVHGFHFYKGAPLLNWLIYYSVERKMANYTDALITLNDEDYSRAQKFRLRLHGKAHKISGVGVDIEKFRDVVVNVELKKAELGINEEDFVMLSVGEINRNKNHEVIIRALSEKNHAGIKYIICGEGIQLQNLRNLVSELKMDDCVIFLGYRKDIPEICKCADIFVFPSFREGMPVALMEAMASGLPAIASNVRGNVDLIENGVNGYLASPDDSHMWREYIEKLKNDSNIRTKIGVNNVKKMQQYSKQRVKEQLIAIYREHGIIS